MCPLLTGVRGDAVWTFTLFRWLFFLINRRLPYWWVAVIFWLILLIYKLPPRRWPPFGFICLVSNPPWCILCFPVLRACYKSYNNLSSWYPVSTRGKTTVWLWRTHIWLLLSYTSPVLWLSSVDYVTFPSQNEKKKKCSKFVIFLSFKLS